MLRYQNGIMAFIANEKCAGSSPARSFMKTQPTVEELQEAIKRHVQKSAEVVAKIPWHMRTIVSRIEVEQRQLSGAMAEMD